MGVGIEGSIPAHAGEPRVQPPRVRAGGVYPRARGGARGGDPQRRAGRGLSPRTRGSRSNEDPTKPVRGSIPAHAGEPSCESCQHPIRKVYPRARGGAPTYLPSRWVGTGLSPRTRGSRKRIAYVDVPKRSIPAHAGEPKSSTRSAAWKRVYPRARGGALPRRWKSSRVEGLSPRTRGSRRHHRRISGNRRSIPAHAGEPFYTRRTSNQTLVYPRARGGAYKEAAENAMQVGLSPRTRGSPLG